MGGHRLEAGYAVLVNGRTAHRLIATEDAAVFVADLRHVGPAHDLPSPLVVADFSSRHAGVAQLIDTCPLSEGCHSALFAASYAGLLGAAMTASWLDDEGPRPHPADGDALVAEVTAAVTARPCEAWTLDRMARLTHLSRSALTERFRRVAGQSPMQLVREIRMREARLLLGDTGRPVTQIAFAVGYGSVAAFSRAFSAHHGLPPHIWRSGSAPGGAQ